MKNVLILGAGMVARPMTRYLLEEGISVKVASRTLSKAENLVKGYPEGKAVEWTVDEKKQLRDMIGEADCVVSLLPYVYHVEVAEICLDSGKNMVTTSYVSDEMQVLDKKAREKNILLLNEIGLDPGIDHLSAQSTIDKIHNQGGKVIAFHSYCGALPAPSSSDNPFRYKFGWSPRGVALAGRNSARYLKNGEEIKVRAEDLFKNYFVMEMEVTGDMEIYPNRDSIQYLSKYNIQEAEEIFRGTIRYPGWCDLWLVISNIGLLNTEEKPVRDMTYREYISWLVGSKKDNPREAITYFLGWRPEEEVFEKLEWVGLFSEKKIPFEKTAPIDVLVELLKNKLSYSEGERDMVILWDEVVAEINGRKEILLSKLIDYGTMGEDTAVARTVSLPAACAVKLILEGKIKETGVKIPTIPEIYEPVLSELPDVGIELKESKKLAGEEFGLDEKFSNA